MLANFAMIAMGAVMAYGFAQPVEFGKAFIAIVTGNAWPYGGLLACVVLAMLMVSAFDDIPRKKLMAEVSLTLSFILIVSLFVPAWLRAMVAQI